MAPAGDAGFAAGMVSGDPHVPDWRDTGAYAPLAAADRATFAWEWLRRDAGYRSAAGAWLNAAGKFDTAANASERWGLHTFEPAAVAAPDARPVWTARVHRFVLAAAAGSGGGVEDLFDLSRLGIGWRVVPGRRGVQHLLVSDGLRSLRLDVRGQSLVDGPALLRYEISGLAAAEAPQLTLRRFLAAWRTGGFAPALHRPEPRARRWILMLRAADALAAGADQRDIAAFLLSRLAYDPRWRSETPSLRTQVQRLVRSSRSMGAGKYWQLIR